MSVQIVQRLRWERDGDLRYSHLGWCWRGAAVAVVLMVAGIAGGGPACAQVGPGGAINPNRDCQTVLTCNFRKDGSYRGCLSSYACRQCRFVAARCSIGGARRRTCQRLQCSWG